MNASPLRAFVAHYNHEIMGRQFSQEGFDGVGIPFELSLCKQRILVNLDAFPILTDEVLVGLCGKFFPHSSRKLGWFPDEGVIRFFEKGE